MKTRSFEYEYGVGDCWEQDAICLSCLWDEKVPGRGGLIP